MCIVDGNKTFISELITLRLEFSVRAKRDYSRPQAKMLDDFLQYTLTN